MFSGDVLFQGSVGRVDLPGGDWPTLLASIRGLVDGYPPETTVYPGHMGITTLGAERATNPFLAEFARRALVSPPPWPSAFRPPGAPSTSCPPRRWPGCACSCSPRASSVVPATSGSRRRSSSRPSCSRAGSAARPTSCARRCSASRTRAGAASPCDPRRPPASVAPTSQRACRRLAQPVKLWWYGPLFRHERPQAGRFRQFTQLDAEAIGSDSPLVDAELIALLDELLRGLGVPGLELRIGSLGSLAARAAYRDELRAYLRDHEADLAPDVRERIDENPLRAFDSKDESTRCGDGRGADDARPPRGRGRRALRGGAPAARPGGAALCGRRRPGPRARLLHAHRVRVPLRPARRSVPGRRRGPLRRPDRAARRAAHSGLRLGGRHRADPDGARRGAGRGRRRRVRGGARRATRAGLRARARAAQRRACTPTSTSPGARSRAR